MKSNIIELIWFLALIWLNLIFDLTWYCCLERQDIFHLKVFSKLRTKGYVDSSETMFFNYFERLRINYYFFFESMIKVKFIIFTVLHANNIKQSHKRKSIGETFCSWKFLYASCCQSKQSKYPVQYFIIDIKKEYTKLNKNLFWRWQFQSYHTSLVKPFKTAICNLLKLLFFSNSLKLIFK